MTFDGRVQSFPIATRFVEKLFQLNLKLSFCNVLHSPWIAWASARVLLHFRQLWNDTNSLCALSKLCMFLEQKSWTDFVIMWRCVKNNIHLSFSKNWKLSRLSNFTWLQSTAIIQFSTVYIAWWCVFFLFGARGFQFRWKITCNIRLHMASLQSKTFGAQHQNPFKLKMACCK